MTFDYWTLMEEAMDALIAGTRLAETQLTDVYHGPCCGYRLLTPVLCG